MSQWVSSPVAVQCGYAGCRIPAREPYAIREGPGWRKIRCRECAHEPVGEVLHLEDAREAVPRPIVQPAVAYTKPLPFDAKQRAAGEKD